MSGAISQRRLFLPLFGALVLLAWASLWAWSRSPYGAWLGHEDWTAAGPLADLCRRLPGGELVVPAAIYALAWIVMTAAMMLPSTLPLLSMFDRLSAARADHGRLMVLLVLGYLAVWGLFGVLAHGVHAAVLWAFSWTAARLPALAWQGWIIAAAVVATAGAFQFSELKRRCLARCRSPFGFINRHWRGGAGSAQAFALGAHHGLFCVGCCWALMLLMFALGAGSLGWMLLLAAAMAVEKNVSWGRRLSAPLGVLLLGWAGVMVASHVAGA
jgi:predicted metal-binding membrane protein